MPVTLYQKQSQLHEEKVKFIFYAIFCIFLILGIKKCTCNLDIPKFDVIFKKYGLVWLKPEEVIIVFHLGKGPKI